MCEWQSLSSFKQRRQFDVFWLFMVCIYPRNQVNCTAQIIVIVEIFLHFTFPFFRKNVTISCFVLHFQSSITYFTLQVNRNVTIFLKVTYAMESEPVSDHMPTLSSDGLSGRPACLKMASISATTFILRCWTSFSISSSGRYTPRYSS